MFSQLPLHSAMRGGSFLSVCTLDPCICYSQDSSHPSWHHAPRGRREGLILFTQDSQQHMSLLFSWRLINALMSYHGNTGSWQGNWDLFWYINTILSIGIPIIKTKVSLFYIDCWKWILCCYNALFIRQQLFQVAPGTHGKKWGIFPRAARSMPHLHWWGLAVAPLLQHGKHLENIDA